MAVRSDHDIALERLPVRGDHPRGVRVLADASYGRVGGRSSIQGSASTAARSRAWTAAQLCTPEATELSGAELFFE
ncbi:hypothetical protein [Streptomyces mirabilis]|uniref:hypothetical protein n=1 Tax=Streptomyces mirabilis TaxID=68239 RepID=UPI00332D4FC5